MDHPIMFSNLEIESLKKVILNELIEKIHAQYGERAFLLFDHAPIIVRGDLLGFALLHPEPELEILHTFPDLSHLVAWMGKVSE